MTIFIQLFAMVFATHPIPYLDAANLEEAQSMYYLELRKMEYTRQRCVEANPSSRAQVDEVFLQWHFDNEDEILSSVIYWQIYDDKIMRPLNKASQAALKVLIDSFSNDKISDYCRVFVSDIKSGNQSVHHRTPKASHFLKSFLKTIPQLNDARARYRSLYTCVEAGIGMGEDFLHMNMQCVQQLQGN